LSLIIDRAAGPGARQFCETWLQAGLDIYRKNEYSFRTLMQTQTERSPASDKREAVLDAALKLFAAQGFHGTSMPEVAEKARVGAGTIYRYFDSKEALVNALFQRWKAELGQHLLGDMPPELPPREVFHRVWTRLAGFAQQYPEAFVFLELHHHQPYLDAESVRIEMGLLQMLGSFVETATAAGAFKALPPAVLIALGYGAMSGLLKAASLGHVTLTPKLIEQAGDCVWEALKR
jgi:AcrR family transcriptional regulator